MTGVAELVALILAVVTQLTGLSKVLAELFKVPESKLRQLLADNHQITDETAEKALALIKKTTD